MQLTLDYKAACEARERGIQLAVDKADRDCEDWSEKAFEFLKKFLDNHFGPFMVEEIRAYAVVEDFSLPENARAWGGPIKRAAAANIIKRIGYKNTSNVKAHRTPAALWIKV